MCISLMHRSHRVSNDVDFIFEYFNVCQGQSYSLWRKGYTANYLLCILYAPICPYQRFLLVSLIDQRISQICSFIGSIDDLLLLLLWSSFLLH